VASFLHAVLRKLFYARPVLISPMRSTCDTNIIFDLINQIFALKQHIYEAPECAVCFSILLFPLSYTQIFFPFLVLPLETKTSYTPIYCIITRKMQFWIRESLGLLTADGYTKDPNTMAANISRILYGLNRFMSKIVICYYSYISQV
jgi:hypothetical protein